MSKRQYYWYIEPFDADANWSVSNLLQTPEGDRFVLSDHECEDGQKHFVYECQAGQRRLIERSVKSVGLNLQIWVRQGRNCKVRKWDPKKIRERSRQKKAKLKLDKQPLLF